MSSNAPDASVPNGPDAPAPDTADVTFPETEKPIRRILVALDGSPHSLAALNAAARLASDLGAELDALFIEDTRLVRTAALPMMQEVRAYTAPPHTLTSRRLRRQLRYQAEQARQAARRAAEQFEVAHSFRTVEGRVAAALLEAAEQADLLALGKTSRAGSSQRSLGRTARRLLTEAASPVLVISRVLHTRQPVVTYYDGTAPSARALALAADLAGQAVQSPLKVLIPAQDAETLTRLRDAVIGRYADAIPRLHVRPMVHADRASFADAVRRAGNGLLILPSAFPFLQDDHVQSFLRDLDRPVLITR